MKSLILCGALALQTTPRRVSRVALRSLPPGDYLSSLSLAQETPVAPSEEVAFAHATREFFALDKLQAKGPRKNADVGEPHDATRKLVSVGPTASGSWWCAAGGWPSLTPRSTTEVFFVFAGHGCLTDLDGLGHYFGPGDTVVLPKGWSGRWDVLQPIHKVWCVHDHPRVEETSHPIRARVVHYAHLAPGALTPRMDATLGAPATASRTLYDVGPVEVGSWTCTPGSFPVVDRPTTEYFHVLEGTFFLTNADGSARRCVAGDTLVCPKGWSGHWDVIDTVKKLWVIVDDV